MVNWEDYLPGMCVAVPPLHSDFGELAEARDLLEDMLVKHLLFNGEIPQVPLTVLPGVKQTYEWVSGHGIDCPGVQHRGPRKQYEVAFCGKALSYQDSRQLRLFSGRVGSMLKQFLVEVGLGDYKSIYLTNLLKTTPLQPKKFSATWLKAQAPFLRMELLITRPKFVVAFGAEATKYLTESKQSLSELEGRWVDIEWDTRFSVDDPVTDDSVYRFKVLPCMHPAALEYESREEDVQRIRDTLKVLERAVNGDTAVKAVEHPVYPVIRNMEDLREQCRIMCEESVMDLCAVDAEWQGEHPQNAGAFLRCVQFAWKPGKAFVLHLTDTEGNPDFTGSSGNKDRAARLEAFDYILQVFRERNLRVAGYYFPADMEVLNYNGLDLSPWYEPAETVEECRTKGGVAVELAVAAVDELSRNNLDTVRWRFTDYPPYEHELKEFLKAEKSKARSNAKSKHATEEDQEELDIVESGYGWVPEELLYPYAGADADVTLRLAIEMLTKHLDRDRFGNNCWLPYFNALGASLTAAEIMAVGLPVDSQQALALAKVYAQKYVELRDYLRKLLSWPDWNVRSSSQVVEAMYGKRYSTVRAKDGTRKSVRPPGAKTLALHPVLDNDKTRQQEWSKIEEMQQEDLHVPGTNAKTIGVISNDPQGVAVRRYDPVSRSYKKIYVPEVEGLTLIRDLRAIAHMRQTFVGKYGPNKDTGVLEYVGGIPRHVCDDGYVRAFISQAKETGRWSASRPNLHGIPKRKEDRYENIMGNKYPGTIRSMFAAPPGYVILEADYKTAELFMLAAASGDKQLWQHCQNSLLSKDHPDYIDIHAKVGVTGLRLNCAPTKAGLKSIGKEYMRDVAKCYAEGEMIGTECGWMPVERIVSIFGKEKRSTAIQPGSFYLQSDAQPTPLLAVHRAGVKECFSIKTELGYELRVSEEHETFVLREGDIQKVKTKDIRNTDALILVPKVDTPKDGSMPLNAELRKACKELCKNDSAVSVAKALGFLAAVNQFAAVRVQEKVALIDLLSKLSKERSTAVLDYLNSWNVDCTYTVCGDSVTIAGDAFVSILDVIKRSQWSGVPEVVFMWPTEARKAFLEGFLLFASAGSQRWPTVVIKPVDRMETFEVCLRACQQLMLSLGLLSKRSQWNLLPYGEECLNWWCNIVGGKETKLTAGSYLQRPVPGVVNRINALCGVKSNSAVLSHSRRECLERLSMLRDRSNSAELDAYGDRLHDFLFRQMGFDRVVDVRSIGYQETYDVQTSRDRNHAVVSGGVLSSNSIVFGWAYGRQPPAIVIQAKEEGIFITLNDAEVIVKSLYELYPDAAEYLERASGRVEDGFLCTPMGRYRRAPESQDRKKLAAYGREFKNSPIQGGVADVVNIAGRRLRELRRETGVKFWIAMQIHDAYLFLVPWSEVETMTKFILPEGMSRRVPIVPRRLNGDLIPGAEPKFMSIDVTCYFRWGVTPTLEEYSEAGINPNWFK